MPRRPPIGFGRRDRTIVSSICRSNSRSSVSAPHAGSALTRWDFATDLDEEPEKWRQHFATLDAHQPFRGFVFRVAADDGSAHYVAASGKPVFDTEGRFLGYRGVGSDVTAAVRAEQAEEALHKTQMELAHVARVTTLGELAASIAHEVNQPLTAIVINGEAGLRWLDREVPDLTEAREALGGIISSGRRASEIIHRLRALSRKTETQKAALDINDAISEVIPLVQQEVLSHRVSLRLDLAPTLPAVLGDRVQLQQVILNLIVNGVEAMAPVTDRSRELVVRSQLDDSGQVLVAVEDSGVGIDPENAKQALQCLLHHQTQRNGHGPVDLPLDHRGPRRQVMGLAQRRAWCDVSVHLTVASGGPLVTGMQAGSASAPNGFS